MSGLYGKTMPEALMGGLTDGEQDQTRLILVASDGQDQALTAPHIRALMASAARQARSAGIEPGEPVLLLFQHGLPVIQGFLGLLMAGAVPCLLPYWSDSAAPHTAAEVHRLAARLGVRWVMTSGELSGPVGELLATGSLRLFALQEEESESSDEALSLPELTAKATAYLQLTSGTTDAPKLIAVPHDAVLNHMRALHAHLALQATDTFVGWLPLHHDMGLITQLWLPLMTGIRTVMIPPDYWVRRPRVLFQAVHRYRGTITFMPNFAFSHCTRYVGDKDLCDLNLTHWRRVINGAEPVRESAMRAFADLLQPYGLSQAALGVGYGLGENVGGVTISLPGQAPLVDWISALALQEKNQAVPVALSDGAAVAMVSCGHPIPGTELAILDERRQAVTDRCLGEIAIRGDSLCQAYAGTGPIPDETGWCHTGDLGYLCDGQLYVCDRKNDLIITGGRNIHPQWLEALAADVLGPVAGQAVAFAVSNPHLGTDLPVLVCEARGKLDAAQQADWTAKIRSRVQNDLRVTLADIQMVQRGWVVQTTSGKVARNANRDKYLAEGRRPEPPGLVLLRAAGNDRELLARGLTVLCAEMLGVETVQAGSSFFDLGGDSLTALRFVLAVEEATGRRVPTEFFQEPTVTHLVRLLVDEPANLPEEQPVAPAAAVAAPPARKERTRSWRRRVRSLSQWARVRVRTAIEAQTFRQPYFEGVRWLLRWCGQPWAQALLYPHESQLVRDFAASMGTPTAQVAQETRLSLASHLILARRNSGLLPGEQGPLVTEPVEAADLYPLQGGDWSRYFDLEGAAFLDDAIRQDRGIICVGPHSPTRFAARLYLERRFKQQPLAGHSADGSAWHDLLDGQDLSFAEGLPADRASVAMTAAHSLSQKGAIGIAGDQEDAQAGLPVIIGDRLHLLAYGVAELAVTTGAHILPFYTQLLIDGRIRIRFLPLLAWDRAETQDDQIKQILWGYAACQTALWRQAPGALLDRTMRRHLACPQIAEAATQAPGV